MSGQARKAILWLRPLRGRRSIHANRQQTQGPRTCDFVFSLCFLFTRHREQAMVSLEITNNLCRHVRKCFVGKERKKKKKERERKKGRETEKKIAENSPAPFLYCKGKWSICQLYRNACSCPPCLDLEFCNEQQLVMCFLAASHSVKVSTTKTAENDGHFLFGLTTKKNP